MKTYCECGHRKEEHRGGEKCEACACVKFNPAPTEKKFNCVVCGHPSDYEVCSVCVKKVEDRWPGDTFNHLFGVRDSRDGRISNYMAKKLSLDMIDAKVTVKTLWDFWKERNNNG